MGLIQKILSLFGGNKQQQETPTATENTVTQPIEPAQPIEQDHADKSDGEKATETIATQTVETVQPAEQKQEDKKEEKAVKDTPRTTTVREFDIYDSIMSSKADTAATDEIDSTVSGILSVLQTPDDTPEELEPEEQELRAKIIAICQEILAEQNQSDKTEKVRQLLAAGAGMTAITIFTIRLREMTGF